MMQKTGTVRRSSLLIAGFAMLGACAQTPGGPWTDSSKGALFGAGAGAAVGAYGHGGRGALIGAIGGGLAGALVGRYMDHQKQDLQRVLAPEIASGAITVTPLPQNGLDVTMTSQTAFDFNSTAIKPGFDSTLNKIAQILVTYGKTRLDIIGYTDSIGSAAYNQVLSQRRAAGVEDYLAGRGVLPQRMTAFGMGAAHPRASNATAAGRQLNRRVEIEIKPVVAS